LANVGKFKEAAKHFQDALAANPTDSEIEGKLHTVIRQIQDHDRD
jgi:hypothetical protein